MARTGPPYERAARWFLVASLGIQALMAGSLGALVALPAGPPSSPAGGWPSQTGAIEELRIELAGEPAAAYRTDEPIAPQHRELAAELARRAPALAFSSHLAEAARAYAAAVGHGEHESLPEELLDFTLHWAGAPEPTGLIALLYTTEESAADLWEYLESVLRTAGGRHTHVGIGRAPDTGGRFRTRWGILLTTRRLALAPLPRVLEAGRPLELAFELEKNLADPRVVIQEPDGEILQLSLRREAGGWRTSAELGETRGEVQVEIIASGARGPDVVALFPVYVAAEPPRAWRGARRLAEDWVRDPADAERALAERVNQERLWHGLPPLPLDPDLVAIARCHSLDMRDTAFVGHISPTAGDLKERLRSAGYSFQYAAENVSKSRGLAEAHAAFLRSPGHRRNLLTPDASHLGVGVAFGADSSGRRIYFITEVFARPAPLPRPPGG
ncbi:MAG: CAP domain-containing protein [Acidobacteriota bacterium]